MRFNGPEYIPGRDQARLTSQICRVWNCMNDGKWKTLKEISLAIGAPEPSVSAQLRHLRKARFGSHEIEREHIARGLFRYRLIPNKNSSTSMYKQSHNEMGVTL